jgi:hypothetical protein
MSERESELTCGQELAASAEVPEAIAALMAHVVLNLRVHADWVGTSSPEACAENEALRAVAEAYEALATAARRAADTMRSFSTLAPVPHDPARFEREPFLAWMRSKVELQRNLARLLLEHAAENERILGK